jgi:hypothetical protein
MWILIDAASKSELKRRSEVTGFFNYLPTNVEPYFGCEHSGAKPAEQSVIDNRCALRWSGRNENSTIHPCTSCIDICFGSAITYDRIRAALQRIQCQTDFAGAGTGFETWTSRENSMGGALSRRGPDDV